VDGETKRALFIAATSEGKFVIQFMILRYLIVHRLRSKFLSYHWFKNWGKRLFTFPRLATILWQGWLWHRRGVIMGNLAGMGKCAVTGNHKLLHIGDFSFVGRSTIQLHASVTIGKSVVINDDVTILTGTHDVNDEHFQLLKKPVIVGNYAWICTGAIVLPGITIGEGAVVAAGAVVAHDVPAYHVVAGNPAKVVRINRSQKLDYKPNLLRACYEAWVGVPYIRK
jgi:acetyltransferase-like isoleucine patch superfamily enzyme